MIEKIRTITWEVRSHGYTSKISEDGTMGLLDPKKTEWSKAKIKKLIWHLQDILRCIRRIEKEKEKKEEANGNNS